MIFMKVLFLWHNGWRCTSSSFSDPGVSSKCPVILTLLALSCRAAIGCLFYPLGHVDQPPFLPKLHGWPLACILREEEGFSLFLYAFHIFFSLCQTHSPLWCFCVLEESLLWPLKETFTTASVFWALNLVPLGALSMATTLPMNHSVPLLW